MFHSSQKKNKSQLQDEFEELEMANSHINNNVSSATPISSSASVNSFSNLISRQPSEDYLEQPASFATQQERGTSIPSSSTHQGSPMINNDVIHGSTIVDIEAEPSSSTAMNVQASNTQPNIEALTQRLQFYEKAILALMSNSKKGSRMRRIEDELLGKESLEDHTIEAILSSSDQKKQEKKQKAEMEKQKILEEQKHDQEEERQYRCNPHLRQKVMTHTGVKKASKTLDQLIMLSLLGGVFIGFGSIAALKTGGNMPGLEKENPGLTKLIFSGVFTVGLTLVIITGAELFTGNTMTMMAAILRGKVNPWDVVRSWVVSLVFNLIGAWAVAYFLMFLPTPQHDIEEETQAGYVNYAIHLAEKKAFRDFWGNFVLAIGCNWLVCLAVYTTYGTSRIMDKLIGLFLPILAFVSSGFEHSIANGFFIPLAMMYGSPITMYDFLIGNMFPVVLGNTVGGGVFVGMVFWWVHGKRQERKHILDEWFLDKLKAKIASPFMHVYEKFQEKWNEYLDLRRINKLIKLQEREERAARMRVVSEFDDAEDMIA